MSWSKCELNWRQVHIPTVSIKVWCGLTGSSPSISQAPIHTVGKRCFSWMLTMMILWFGIWDLILLAGCCHTLDLQLWDRCSLKELQVDGWLTWWCYSATDWFAFACSPIFALAASYPFGSWFTWVFIRVFTAIVPPAPLKRLVMCRFSQPTLALILMYLDNTFCEQTKGKKNSSREKWTNLQHSAFYPHCGYPARFTTTALNKKWWTCSCDMPNSGSSILTLATCRGWHKCWEPWSWQSCEPKHPKQRGVFAFKNQFFLLPSHVPLCSPCCKVVSLVADLKTETSEMFVQLNWQAVASAASHCAAQKWSGSALSGDAVSVGLKLVGWSWIYKYCTVDIFVAFPCPLHLSNPQRSPKPITKALVEVPFLRLVKSPQERKRCGSNGMRNWKPSFVIICLLVVIMIYCSPEQEGLVERKLALACFSLIKGRDVQVLHFCFAQVRPARSADSSFCATRRRPGCSLCSWWGPGGPVHFSINCLKFEHFLFETRVIPPYRWPSCIPKIWRCCYWLLILRMKQLANEGQVGICACNLTHVNEFPWRSCWSPCGFGILTAVSRCWFERLAEEVGLKLVKFIIHENLLEVTCLVDALGIEKDTCIAAQRSTLMAVNWKCVILGWRD